MKEKAVKTAIEVEAGSSRVEEYTWRRNLSRECDDARDDDVYDSTNGNNIVQMTKEIKKDNQEHSKKIEENSKRMAEKWMRI